ncbi:hypothetical protein Rhe02_57290 [Rhizocola hellebori]|uniref:Uncharacterized protein n=1 Tax=Rhizocola hellebori TaxID=1392758 RepID=A0A8J3VIR2_9ACTN|nr:hypothetical protein [Rhizocola hellebori]GIH07662.1 hypothetical protein Rhe02_57290 [Rhizocola hellebori]
MSVDVSTARVRDIPDDRWAGTPLASAHWLESTTGFPQGSVGAHDSGGGAEVVCAVRGFRLTRQQVTEVLAFAEFLAGSALTPADRAEIEEDIIDAFEDSPKAAVKFLQPISGGVARMGSMDPIERCQRRLHALTSSYTVDQRKRSDGADPDPVMSVVGRYNPLVRYWASTGIVLVEDALSARFQQHQLVLSLIGREPEPAQFLRERLLARLGDAGAVEIADLAAAEFRLLSMRAWLRDLGEATLRILRADLLRAVPSALDMDIVVQQVGFRAALSAS